MQTKEKLSTTITEMLSEVDNAGSRNIAKEIYKGRIIEMVEKIESKTDLEMIYGMTKAAYNDIKELKAEEY